MLRKTFLLAVAATSIAATGLAQSARSGARDLFYTKSPRQGMREAWLGLRTTLMVRVESADGVAFREVLDSTPLRSGDFFRLRVQPNAAGFLYLVGLDSDGRPQLLYPEASEGSRLRAFETRTLPSSEDWMRLDQEAGIEHVYLIHSDRRIPLLDKLRNGDGARLTLRQWDALLSDLGGGRSLLETESTVPGAIAATYYTEFVTGSDPSIVRHLEILNRPARARN